MQIRHKETGAVLAEVPADALVDTNLAGRDLRGADLRGVKMLRVNLAGANLAQADLSGARLDRVVLNGANLTGTRWRGALLFSALAEGANFTDADLSEMRSGRSTTISSGLWLYLILFPLINLAIDGVRGKLNRGTVMAYLPFIGIGIFGAWLRERKLQKELGASGPYHLRLLEDDQPVEGNMSAAALVNANLENAVMKHYVLTGANLSGARLRGAALRYANLTAANLTGCDLRGANLHGADLPSANLAGADLRGANLSAALMAGANVNGAVYDKKTVWPSDFMYHRHGAVYEAADMKEAMRRLVRP